MSVLYDKIFPIFHLPLKTFLKICASVVVVALLLLPCVYFSGSRTFEKFPSTPEVQKSLKTILYWTKMFDNKDFYFGEGSDIFQGCPVSSCRATSDRKLLDDVEEYHAVLFHAMQTRRHDLPVSRSPMQKYIFVELEAPANSRLESAYVPERFYNWTMTYRRDSDIPRAYGYIIHSESDEVAYPRWTGSNAPPGDMAYENFRSPGNYTAFQGKRKTAAWFVSHCRTSSRRERYVVELQKYVDVDVYGRCGPRYCPPKTRECYEMLEARYYFYLSFENSLCDDYVSEKLYKALAYNVVPVVYGGANYSDFAPPGSFVNVADFKSPKHLANYLHYLVNNPQEYAKFFRWKKHFFVDLSHRPTLCKMCAMLHDQEHLARSECWGLKDWWSNGKCREPAKFTRQVIRH